MNPSQSAESDIVKFLQTHLTLRQRRDDDSRISRVDCMADLAKSRKCLQGTMPKSRKMREKSHFSKKNEKNSENAPG